METRIDLHPSLYPSRSPGIRKEVRALAARLRLAEKGFYPSHESQRRLGPGKIREADVPGPAAPPSGSGRPSRPVAWSRANSHA